MILMVEAVLEMAVAAPVYALEMVQKGEVEPLKNELMGQVEKPGLSPSEKAEPVP